MQQNIIIIQNHIRIVILGNISFSTKKTMNNLNLLIGNRLHNG